MGGKKATTAAREGREEQQPPSSGAPARARPRRQIAGIVLVAAAALGLGVFLPASPLHAACFPDAEALAAETVALCNVDFAVRESAPAALARTPRSSHLPCPYEYGAFRRAVADPAFHPLTPFQRLFELKHWHWHAVAAPPFLVGAAVADFGFAGAAFAYVLDTRTGKIFQREFQLPLHMGVTMAPSAVRGCTSFSWPWDPSNPVIAMCYDEAREAYHFTVDMTLSDNVHLSLDVYTGTRTSPAAAPTHVNPAAAASSAAATKSSYANNPEHAKLETITLAFPLGPTRPAYTTKLSGLPAEGTIALTNLPVPGTSGREAIRLPVSPASASASMDWTRALHRRFTVWRWVALSFVDPSGDHVGVQLSEGVYAGPGRETGIWVNGVLYPLAVHINATVGSLQKEWSAFSLDEPRSIELTYRQLGAQRSEMHAVVFDCDLNHTIGLYSGVLRVDGKEYKFVDRPGVFEDHVALW